MRILSWINACVLAVALCACTSGAAKRAAYEAVYQKECLDRTGVPNCDPAHKSYDEYTRDRNEALERDSEASKPDPSDTQTDSTWNNKK